MGHNKRSLEIITNEAASINDLPGSLAVTCVTPVTGGGYSGGGGGEGGEIGRGE